jgi:hypothetical protein
MFMGHYKQTVKPQHGTCSHSHSWALVRGVRGLLAVFWYAEELAACLWVLGEIQLQFVLKMQSYVTVLPITLHFPKMSCASVWLMSASQDRQACLSVAGDSQGLGRQNLILRPHGNPWETWAILGPRWFSLMDPADLGRSVEGLDLVVVAHLHWCGNLALWV